MVTVQGYDKYINSAKLNDKSHNLQNKVQKGWPKDKSNHRLLDKIIMYPKVNFVVFNDSIATEIILIMLY